MLIPNLSLGEEINNLDLSGKVVEGDRLVTSRAPSEVGVDTNVLGQLMLDWIGCNLKSPSAVTMKRSGGGNEHTKFCRSQRSQITS